MNVRNLLFVFVIFTLTGCDKIWTINGVLYDQDSDDIIFISDNFNYYENLTQIANAELKVKTKNSMQYRTIRTNNKGEFTVGGIDHEIQEVIFWIESPIHKKGKFNFKPAEWRSNLYIILKRIK